MTDKLTKDQVETMDYLALCYQEGLVQTLADALLMPAKPGDGRQVLSDELAKMVAWRQRFEVATDAERASSAMFNSFLQCVHQPMSVFGYWFTEESVE